MAAHVQRHAAVLDAGKLQQFLHHAGEPLGFAEHDAHATLKFLPADIGIGQQGFAPAGDGRQWGTQLMGHRRDQFRLHPLGPADGVGHLVDGLGQFADLVLGNLLNVTAVAAGGDALGRGRDLGNRLQNGAQKVIAAEDDKQDKGQTDQNNRGCDQQNLPVSISQACHIAQDADDLTVGVNQRCGDRQNPLSGSGILAHEGYRLPLLHRIRNVRGSRRGAGPLGIGGRNQPSAGVDKLELHGVLVLEALGKGDAGLIELVIALRDIALKEAAGRIGFGLHAGAERRVVIGRDHHRKDDDAGDHNGQHHAEGIGKPSGAQAAAPTSKNRFRSQDAVLFYAPHL